MNQLIVRDEDVRFLCSRTEAELRKLKITYGNSKGSYAEKMLRIADRLLQEHEGVEILPSVSKGGTIRSEMSHVHIRR